MFAKALVIVVAVVAAGVLVGQAAVSSVQGSLLQHALTVHTTTQQ